MKPDLAFAVLGIEQIRRMAGCMHTWRPRETSIGMDGPGVAKFQAGAVKFISFT